MASNQNHRKQLVKYLTDKQNSSRESSKSRKVPSVINLPPRKGKATIYNIPDEIMLKIFGYLSMGDLLSVAQVCHLWHQLSSDNLLWKQLLQKCAPTQPKQEVQYDMKTSNLKSSFMQRCIEMRNKRVLRILKKKNPYTGIIHCKDVENAIKYSGLSWQIVLTDNSGNEHTLQHQDVTYHLLSVSVRWYSLTMIAVSNVKKICVYSCNPLFFDTSTGKVIINGPYQRSLLCNMDTRLSLVLDQLKPVGSDENLKVYAIGNGLVMGVWKDGGEIAFITMSFALPNLVKRCLMGSSSSLYETQKEKVPSLLTESSFGLYGYSCTIQLRTMKQELWDQQFINVECPNSDIKSGFAHFQLIRENGRQLLQKELVFPWKTDAFKGKVKNVCCLDTVLTNNEGQVVWFCSSAVSVKKDCSRKYTFDMDFDYCREQSRCIEYSDDKGKIFIQIDQDEDTTYITYATLLLSVDVLTGKEQRTSNKSSETATQGCKI